jgi:hypothetical protein
MLTTIKAIRTAIYAVLVRDVFENFIPGSIIWV